MIRDEETQETLTLRQALGQIPGRFTQVRRRVADVPASLNLHESARLLKSMTLAGDLVALYEPAAVIGPMANFDKQLCLVASRKPLDEAVAQGFAARTFGGIRRFANLVAAAGCFVMSILGVITPGIPTVPFVLATGYFLARSSPKIHERFRRSPFFGRMLTDYEDLGGLRYSTKIRAILFTVVILVATVVLSAGSLPLLIIVFAMGGLGIYMVSRIPTIREDATPQVAGA